MMSRILFSILFLLSFLNKSFATAQFGDILITDEDTVWINSNPLEFYFEEKGERTIAGEEMKGLCTALWRGYVATWQLENDSLFLISIQTNYCGDHPIDLDMIKEFNSKRVFAKWATTTIVKPEGALLNYIHMGYMSVYEGETFYEIEKGLLVNTKRKNYLVYDKNRVFPGERFLRDTIQSMILGALPLEERQDFNEKNYCWVNIYFDDDGQIREISGEGKGNAETLMQTVLVKKAKEVLKDFPKLMKVDHDMYSPPYFQLWFSGHCLKNPYDREYGCDYE